MIEFMEWDTEQTKQLGPDPVEVIEFYYGTRDDSLPDLFAPPEGCLLLATDSDHAAGVFAFKQISSNICQLTRMYVRPEFRGEQVARKLIQMLITKARESGYDTTRLETTTFIQPAIALYFSFGFKTRPPYYEIPEKFLDSAIFMELDLSA